MDVDKIIRYENGEMGVAETLELFASLIKIGTVRYLQGHYGRTAQSLIDSGYITPEGEIDAAGRELLEEVGECPTS